jgi:hypothetical protein
MSTVRLTSTGRSRASAAFHTSWPTPGESQRASTGIAAPSAMLMETPPSTRSSGAAGSHTCLARSAGPPTPRARAAKYVGTAGDRPGHIPQVAKDAWQQNRADRQSGAGPQVERKESDHCRGQNTTKSRSERQPSSPSPGCAPVPGKRPAAAAAIQAHARPAATECRVSPGGPRSVREPGVRVKPTGPAPPPAKPREILPEVSDKPGFSSVLGLNRSDAALAEPCVKLPLVHAEPRGQPDQRRG